MQVSQQHAGQYSCQPFNQRGSAAPSPIIQVIIKDPPTLLSRPNNEYIKNVGGKVSFACQAAGTPTPDIRWRRVRISIFNKAYFISNMPILCQKSSRIRFKQTRTLQ